MEVKVHNDPVPKSQGFEFVSSVALAVTELCYFTTAGLLAKAQANSAATLAVVMALEKGDAQRGVRCALPGMILDHPAWTWTAGSPVYLSAATAGAMTQSAPGTPNKVQIVGIALTPTSMLFNPDFYAPTGA